MAERKTLGSWREVLNAYTWETIRAEYWRQNDDPEVADYVQAMARNAQWNQMGVLERMGHQPLSPEVIAENRRKWGIKGR